MYPLGKQFIFNSDVCKTDEKYTIIGQHYRISVLSDMVVRLEYSPSGTFNDRPTQLVRRRNFSKGAFKVDRNQTTLMITTKYFTLVYQMEQPFKAQGVDPMKNLKITLNSRDPDRQKDWYYGNLEVRNLGGNIVSDDVSVSREIEKGLYSLDGFSSIDDSKSKIILEDGTLGEPIADNTDIYVFMYDTNFRQVLFDYFKLTGAPSMLPRYAFGNWWSRNVIYSDKDLKELIRNFEKKKIPLSVMLFDNDWHIRNASGKTGLKTGFTFNNALIKDPKAMVDNFHKRGIRVGLVVDPQEGFYPHEAFYKQASEALKVTDGGILPFDALNPQSIDLFFKMFLHPLENIGIDFFWNDSKAGMDLNRLWSLQHYMYMDSNRFSNKRGMILSRSGCKASHRYPVLYGGSSEISWKNLKSLPFKYLNAANVGVSWWSHDVGGNHGGIEDDDLYIRYLELGVFSPILRFHGARGPYYKKEPWLWDAKTQSIAGDYLRLRHRLIPYIYTEAYNYTRTGTPLVQPFFYNYMWTYDDPLYRNQYYFGSQLLVCPILDKKDPTMNRTIHRFFIPDGIWYDYVTGKRFLGNKKYISFFKDEDYPVFAHAGSIIPLSNRSDYNNTGLPTDMEIQIFPGVSNTYTLYEDDGITSLYKDGYYLKTSIDYNYLKNNYTVIIRSIEGKSGIIPEKRNYKMVFRNVREADDVTAFFDRDAFNNIDSYVDGNDFIVELNDVPTIGQLTVNCKGKNIEIDAQRIINDDVKSILLDLKINTYLKEELADIMFGELPIGQKRIEIRKMKKKGLSKEYLNMFLKLLEYMAEV